MKINLEKIKIKDLAGLISQLLANNGIEVILVGGACVTIYSRNRYISGDLDFVTHARIKELVPLLQSLGFEKKSGRHFEHPKCEFFIEFLSPPVAIGNEPIKGFNLIETKYGPIKALTVEDCIKDRLAAFYWWNDPQAMEQAILLVRSFPKQINFDLIKKWSRQEGQVKNFQKFLKLLGNLK